MQWMHALDPALGAIDVPTDGLLTTSANRSCLRTSLARRPRDYLPKQTRRRTTCLTIRARSKRILGTRTSRTRRDTLHSRRIGSKDSGEIRSELRLTRRLLSARGEPDSFPWHNPTRKSMVCHLWGQARRFNLERLPIGFPNPCQAAKLKHPPPQASYH